MTRSEHVQWAKQRSFQYLDSGNLDEAYASFISDLSKHRETKNHPALQLGIMLMMTDKLNDIEKMRKFINDFN